jgi:hypothetical protein
MKAYIIQNGHFSKRGNFIAFSTKGERIHIYRKDIIKLFPQVGIVYRCSGQYELELVKFPFYCIADHLTFDNTDGTTFTRLTGIEIHSSDYAIKAKAELQSTIDYYEEQLKYYTFEAADRGRRLDSYREAYDKLAEEHDALVAKVDHYDANYKEQEFLIRQQVEQEIGYEQYMYDQLAQENDKLKDDFNAMKWNYEYAQTERERLELLCKQQENLIYDYKHILGKIKGLSSVDDNNDIINTIY